MNILIKDTGKIIPVNNTLLNVMTHAVLNVYPDNDWGFYAEDARKEIIFTRE